MSSLPWRRCSSIGEGTVTAGTLADGAAPAGIGVGSAGGAAWAGVVRADGTGGDRRCTHRCRRSLVRRTIGRESIVRPIGRACSGRGRCGRRGREKATAPFRGGPPISGLPEIGNTQCQSRLKPTLVARTPNPVQQQRSISPDSEPAALRPPTTTGVKAASFLVEKTPGLFCRNAPPPPSPCGLRRTGLSGFGGQVRARRRWRQRRP